MPADPGAAGGALRPPAVLIHGDTERSPALRHEVPLAIGDPFLYDMACDVLAVEPGISRGGEPPGSRTCCS